MQSHWRVDLWHRGILFHLPKFSDWVGNANWFVSMRWVLYCRSIDCITVKRTDTFSIDLYLSSAHCLKQSRFTLPLSAHNQLLKRLQEWTNYSFNCIPENDVWVRFDVAIGFGISDSRRVIRWNVHLVDFFTLVFFITIFQWSFYHLDNRKPARVLFEVLDYIKAVKNISISLIVNTPVLYGSINTVILRSWPVMANL
jgi:hypothetical protein